MLISRRLTTALIFSAFCASSALAADNTKEDVLITDVMVAQATAQTRLDLEAGITHDVLTTSYQFSPDAEDASMVATVTIQDLPDTDEKKDTDA